MIKIKAESVAVKFNGATVGNHPAIQKTALAFHVKDQAEKLMSIATGDLKRVLQEISEPLSDDDFWVALERFNAEAKKFRDRCKRSDWVENAAEEFFRSACCEASGRQLGEYDYSAQYLACVECCRFVWAYALKVAHITRAFNQSNHELGLSDDSFHDMCDSFPLHGRVTYESALKGHFPETLSLGEYYIEMRLEEKLDHWLSRCAFLICEEQKKAFLRTKHGSPTSPQSLLES